jgi:phospholipase/carboxylesterase
MKSIIFKNNIAQFLRLGYILLFFSMTFQAQSCSPKGDTSLLVYKIRLPKTEQKNPPLLILMHGSGSNEDDMFEYAPYMPDDFIVVSVRAPYTVSQGSYKWYEVKFVENKIIYDPIQAEKSRLDILDFIETLKKKYTFDEKKVYLGGFSQGAIMSLSVGLTHPKKIAGILALSGRVLEEVKTKVAKTEDFAHFKALVLHGTEDQVLPIAYARDTKKLLDSLKINTLYQEIPIGHTTSEETVRLMIDFLK